MDDAKRSGSPLTREELESMPMLQLAIERQGATEKGLSAALEHLIGVAKRADDEWLRGDSARAYLAGVEAGEARYAARMARLALTSLQLGLRDEHMLAQLAAGKIRVPSSAMRTAVMQPVAHANTVRGDAEARDIETEVRMMREDGRQAYADVMLDDMKLPILLDYLEGKINRGDALNRLGLLTPAELAEALKAAGLPEPKPATRLIQ
ncbi:hypothetical protein RSWS8N_08520 [Cereibacter sphaeroides WS8N]|uniref:hypothetical protein n=1 Tax=Cereibacter sphaeroides TaxID=1063 RepID=UPI00020DFA4D|nr:hypothetical protein [Cereibacter sphaeroides]EGJ22112.1 hypothetical protein RSWS8N_08520 [Cereibacter sphaeroides WS8N]